jgi:hypothetical protein
LCSAKISERLVPKIYKLAKAKGLPMTRVVDEVLNDALSKIQVETVFCKVKRKGIRYQIKEA